MRRIKSTLVKSGMLLGAGDPHQALGAALLVVANVVCVNLAGVLTLLLQGLRPRHWWEAARARRASWISAGLCVLMLALLVLLVLSQAKPELSP